MKLIEAVRDLDSFDAGSTVYAAAPWTEDSVVVVAREPESGGLPADAQELGLNYFLEVFLARDFLKGWVAHQDEKPTLQQTCSRLIQYAATDA
ncbi:MAG: hypothetical protein NTV86_01265 [Planctomycetota bacterium]|nr:hypothetical protein [Planctomycetota bacterium]